MGFLADCGGDIGRKLTRGCIWRSNINGKLIEERPVEIGVGGILRW